MCTFKNLEEIWKTWKKLKKISGNPVFKMIVVVNTKYLLRVQLKKEESL